MSDVTRILERLQKGDGKAADELLPLVYEELRRLAAVKMADQHAGHTLQPTALVHEAYLRLVKSERDKWCNSRHFLAAAAESMRQILSLCNPRLPPPASSPTSRAPPVLTPIPSPPRNNSSG